MAESGKKQSSKKNGRGVNVRVVQKSKTSSSKKKTKKQKEEPNFSEFEVMKITRAEKPRESKIVTRDVAKETPPQKLEKNPKIEERPKVEIEIPRKRPVAKRPTPVKLSAKQIKEREIKRALDNAARLPEISEKHSRVRSSFEWPRVVLAITCLATAVFAIVYFVNLTSTDMSIKVAAMQSGIEAKYPSYIPRGYLLSDVTSTDGKIVMRFSSDDGGFTLTEEDSSWDSNALLSNYVKPNVGDEYTVVREQGLTLYMGDGWEAWVNGGILYKLFVNSGELTKKQMKTIATSL